MVPVPYCPVARFESGLGQLIRIGNPDPNPGRSKKRAPPPPQKKREKFRTFMYCDPELPFLGVLKIANMMVFDPKFVHL
jgi:hypothetical protein